MNPKWDDIDELVDHWTWAYYITRKVMGSALERRQMPVIPVTEDVDYKFQGCTWLETECGGHEKATKEELTR